MKRLSKVIASTGEYLWIVDCDHDFIQGMFSRRHAEKVIQDGRVKVNFQSVTSASYKIKDNDKVFVDDLELNFGGQVDRPRLWAVRFEVDDISNYYFFLGK